MCDCRDWEVPAWIKNLSDRKLIELINKPAMCPIDETTRTQAKREMDDRLRKEY